jgi:DNA polymerase-3 subunit alpha
LKFDILTVVTLDTIQMCIDLIKADPKYEGLVVDPDLWTAEYADPQVWDMICGGDTLGIFQIETGDGTKLSKRMQPRSVADLAAIGALVRPGPRRSGLTETYIRRRFGEETTVAAHPLLEELLGRTYQCMVYQEDIMGTCQLLAGYSLEEADEVRKILGKKKVEAAAKEGIKFLEACAARDIDKEAAERIWAQMAEFARYSFNRAHSWGYAMLSYWCAWFKCHFPAHYIVARLSTLTDDDKARIPEFVSLARRYGYQVRPPDVNESGVGFTISADQLSILYGLKSVPGVGDAAAAAIIDHRLYTDIHDFLARRGSACNSGTITKLASIGAFDSILPEGIHRAQLEALIEVVASGKTEMCAHQTDPNIRTVEMCGFDWTSEPVIIGKSGKPLKGKPIPKACSRACRQYSEVTKLVYPEAVPMLTPVEIRKREQDLLGIYLSSSPFDGLDQNALREQGIIFAEGVENLPSGQSIICGLIGAVRTRKDKFDRKMAFMDVDSFGFKVSMSVFASAFEKAEPLLIPDNLALFVVAKNDRGVNYIDMHPILTSV